ncbi:MAG: DUF1028 domain-containing protein [Planctomycetes bacterium]|nr:DUF1028 domain-containing protein [Planctomycetota bacterium]
MQILRRITAFAIAVTLTAAPAFPTWSIVAVNTRTREVCISSATCLSNFNLRLNLPVMRPGIGGGASQALVDSGAANRQIIWNGLNAGLAPQQILQQLLGVQGAQSRQFGIVDFDNMPVTFSGSQTIPANPGVVGVVGEWRYAIQGNILTGNQVVLAAEQAFLQTQGDIGQKVMAAMEAARFWGGDGRCSCNASAPTSCALPPPEPFQSAYTGFFLISRVGDTGGSVCNSSSGCAQGQMYAALNVIGNASTPDPVITLRTQFDAWRAALSGRPDHIASETLADRAALVADGRTEAEVTLFLRDLDGIPVGHGGAAVSVTNFGSSSAASLSAPAVDNGDGTYTLRIRAGQVPGSARFRITVNDGISTVTLWPELTLRVDPVVPLHLGYDAISALDPHPVPIVINVGHDADRRAYLLLASSAGTTPGLTFGNLSLPLNASRLLRYTLSNAGDPDLLYTSGPLPPSGRVAAWFEPDASTMHQLVGTRIEWSGIIFGPAGRSVLPPAGFEVLP